MKKYILSIILILSFFLTLPVVSSAAADTQLTTPEITAFDSTEQGVKITWEPVESASKYRVYYKNRNNNWVKMGTVSDTSFVDTDVAYNKTYTYTVRCMDSAEKNFTSQFNTVGWKYTYTYPYAKPEITSMTNVSEGVRIEWTPIEGVYKYRLYYKNSKGGWTRITETADTYGFDTIVKNNATYTYTVQGVNKSGKFITDWNNKGWKHTYKYPFDKPEIVNFTNDHKGVHINWTPIEGVYKYRVYYKNSKGGWTRITETADTSALDDDVKYNGTYTYTVQGVNKNGRFTTDWNSKGWKHTYALDTPQITSLKSTEEGVKITWKPVEGASKYRVYYKNKNNNWVKMGTVSGTSFIDTDVAYNKTYTYTVRCYDSVHDRFISGFNNTGWKYTYTYPYAKPEITEFTNDYEGVHINWTPIEGVYKYRVYYKNSKGGWTRITETADTTALDDDVKYNGTYTYTVQGVNKSGKFVTDWNSTGWKHTYKLLAPTNVSCYSGSDGIHINWQAVSSAKLYRIYYQNNKGSWTALTTTAATTAIDKAVSIGTSKTYAVCCINKAGKIASDYSKPYQCTYNYIEPTQPPTEAPTEAPLDTPTDVKATIISSGSKTYDTVGKWEITKYYNTGSGDRFEYIANETDYKVIPGQKPLTKERYIESNIEYSDDGSQVTIHWNKTEDKEGCSLFEYNVTIYHKTPNKENGIGNIELVWKKDTNSFVWGHWVNNKWVEESIDTDGTYCTFDLPVITETPAKAKITWNTVRRASKYIVEIYKNGSWNTEATVTKPCYEFTPDGNTTYQYRFKAVNESGTTSAYTYKTFTTESEFVADEEAYIYEEPVYERQNRQICNICGADITGDPNYPKVYHYADGRTSVTYPYIGDSIPEAYDNYLLYYAMHNPNGERIKYSEEEFRYGHRDSYQHLNNDGTQYATWEDGTECIKRPGWDIYSYHGIIDNLDGSGCTGGRWHSDYRTIHVATRTVEVPETGHYEIVLNDN